MQASSRQELVERLLRFYKRWISPMFGDSCRYSPTCSEYAAQAIVERGWLVGSGMAVRRLLRCHPLGSSGYDPVPQKRSIGLR